MAFITRTGNTSKGSRREQSGTTQHPIGCAGERKAKRGVRQRCALMGCLILASLMLTACGSTLKSTSATPQGPASATPQGPPSATPQGPAGPPSASTGTPGSSASAVPPSTTESDYWLSDFNAAQSILTNTWGDAERINGTDYSHTVVIQQSSGVTDPIGGSWDLARQCSTLSFKAAGLIDQASDPGARLIFTVSTDGTQRWHREIDFGSSASVTTLDIANTLRLTLTTTDVGPITTRAEGGFGDAVVRCHAEPPNPKS